MGNHLSSLLKQKFQQLIGEHKAVPREVEVVMGRKLRVYITNLVDILMQCFNGLGFGGFNIFYFFVNFRFRWVRMDVHIFHLRNFVTGRLELQTILACVVSQLCFFYYSVSFYKIMSKPRIGWGL